MNRTLLSLVCVGLLSLPPLCLAQKPGFHFCSRIISVRNGATLGGQSDLGFKEGDPVGCIHQREPTDIKNGVFAGECRDTVVDLKPGVSLFARPITLEDRSGSLRAFTTPLTTSDGRVGQSVCFRHDVPMGGGELADDSPRCFGFNGHPFLMFIAQSCPDGICTTHWLTAAVGKCDGKQVEAPVSTKSESASQTKVASVTDKDDNMTTSKSDPASPAAKTATPPAPAKPIDLSGVPLPPLAG